MAPGSALAAAATARPVTPATIRRNTALRAPPVGHAVRDPGSRSRQLASAKASSAVNAVGGQRTGGRAGNRHLDTLRSFRYRRSTSVAGMSQGPIRPQPHVSYNRRRRIQRSPDPSALKFLGRTVKYRGSPYHKRNPGDFQLTPPAQPLPSKTLCDGAGVFTRRVAQELLRRGVARGMVSVQTRGRFPQNIWSVTDDGYPLEAQLENQEQGIYHGYPMPKTDPFRAVVVSRWSRS